MKKGTTIVSRAGNDSDIDEVLWEIESEFAGKPSELIPILQSVQRSLRYLPEETLLEIARFTGLPPARVFGVATFYAQFRLEPIGKYIIHVCRGTACHVSGSHRMLDDLQTYLGIGPGETTEDGLFTLDTVACFGSCALAPVMVVNGTVHALMDSSKARKILDKLRAGEAVLA